MSENRENNTSNNSGLPHSQNENVNNLINEYAEVLKGLVDEAQALLLAVRNNANAVEAIRTGAIEGQGVIAAARADVEAKVSEITTTSTLALSARTQIADSQTVIATKSEHIQAAQEHADKVRSELDRSLTVATQQATEAEGLKARAQTAADGANDLLTAIKASRAQVDADEKSISDFKEIAANAATQLKALADKAGGVDAKIKDYEARLSDLEKQCEDQLKTITGLLPGATSAGLAHAFDARARTFLKPSLRWQWLFVGSVGLLVLLSISGLWHIYTSEKVLTYDELLRLWLTRLPIAGALIWLALHASREAALAKRLEEDYGYKAAIASSFLGFHEQMLKIGATAADSPLAKLCDDTLSTIGSPPGRIYDKHQLTVTPTDEIKGLVKTMAGPESG